MTFRTRVFAGVFGASAVAVGVTVVLFAVWMRSALLVDFEANLADQADLAAELLSRRSLAATGPDGEAVALGDLLGARVTLIAADGRVLGDSAVSPELLADLEDHSNRTEVAAARTRGSGVAIRRSATTGIETMYAATAVDVGAVAVVRVALPITRVRERLDLVWPVALIGLGTGLAAALLLTWTTSTILSRRIRAVADAAARYRAGDFSVPAADYGRDEIGLVAGTLDRTARELGGRLTEMARERAHMEAILTGMAEGVVLVDAAGRLVLTNPAARRMLRMPDGPEGRHYTDVVRHPDITTQLAAALSGGRPAPVETQIHPDSRRSFMANVVGVTAERDGGAVLVLHDVTDLRRAERVRRDFVANVSHELRTPLTAIRGSLEAMGDAPEPGEARRFLDIIGRHAHRMERLVLDLLRLARLDAGQESVDGVDCSVADLIGAIEHDMQAALTLRRQQIQFDGVPDAGVVHGDIAKLHDVFRNLIENASNYSPEGGVIDVGARLIEGDIVITVADRGPGIPEANLERVFERFYRVDRARASDPGGTGLGLAIVKHLVELHGGSVRAAWREGGGSVFTVVVPM